MAAAPKVSGGERTARLWWRETLPWHTQTHQGSSPGAQTGRLSSRVAAPWGTAEGGATVQAVSTSRTRWRQLLQSARLTPAAVGDCQLGASWLQTYPLDLEVIHPARHGQGRRRRQRGGHTATKAKRRARPRQRCPSRRCRHAPATPPEPFQRGTKAMANLARDTLLAPSSMPGPRRLLRPKTAARAPHRK